MSGLYVYAVSRERPAGALGAGLAGETIVAVDAAGLVVLAGAVAAAPDIDRAALEAHDATVRRLAGLVEACLPARFGTIVADESALTEAVGVQAQSLRETLALVAGGEQMTLRIHGTPPGVEGDDAGRVDRAVGARAEADAARPASEVASPAGEAASRGPGARYLAVRLRDHQRAVALPALAPVRSALGPLVRAERLERHTTPPLVASVYHLIARGADDDYRARLEATRPALAPMRITVSGPWPAYAFAPGLEAPRGAVA